MDNWVANNQETCLFCAERGAAHSDCNKKLRINPKTFPIPAMVHNLKRYDAHHLMQKMPELQKFKR